MHRREEGLYRRYVVVFGGVEWSRLTSNQAGSALIQACEKAGSTVPRYEISKLIDIQNVRQLTEY